MKHLYFYFKVLFIVACCTLSQPSLAALNGTYTINPSLTASATNYQSFQSAISDMLTGTRADGGNANGIGVSGPVVISVAAGTYNGQIEITGHITGASAINNIVFEGGSASSCIIQHNSSSLNSRHTILLSGARYVSFRNFTIRTLGEYGWAIHMNAINTNNITIKKCNIEMTGDAIGASTATHMGILYNSSTSTMSRTGYYCDSLTIDSNNFYNGYCAISLFGNLTQLQLNNRITNNKIYNNSNDAITCRFQNGIHIINNDVKPYQMGDETGMGIYLGNTINSGTSRTIVSNNIVTSFNRYGLSISGISSNPGLEALVFNNILGKGYGCGIRMEANEEMDICNNTIDITDGFNGIDAGLFCDGGSNITLYNNIIAISQPSSLLPVVSTDAFSFDSMDYNQFYRADISDQKLLFMGGVTINPLSYKGALGFNRHSSFKRPEYLNDSNLRITHSCNKGMPFLFVTEDIDHSIRSNPPAIGAHEGTPLRNNLSLVSLVSPSVPFSPGVQDLIVKVQNIGDSIIASFDISYIHNAAAAVSQTWTGSLNPCDTAWAIFTGADQVTTISANEFIIASSLPNGVPDADPKNDTIRTSVISPLNGTYTIGSSPGADFNTFATAVDILKRAGISGPVVFEVEPGTYQEQVSINENITGVSTINTITFDGIDAATRIIENSNTNFQSYHTFQIASDYVTVRNLTIRASNEEYAWGVYINRQNGNNIHVKNCIIDIVAPLHEETFAGIAIAGGTSFYYENEFRVDSIEIDSNIILNGYIGIFHKNSIYNTVPPSSHILFRNNKLLNQSMYGIFCEKAEGLTIHGNTIVMSSNRQENATGISLSEIQASNPSFGLQITSNHIRNVTNSGIDVYTASLTSSNRGLIANNAIISSGYHGIFVDYGDNIDFVNNTIKMDHLLTFPEAGALNVSASTGIGVINNQLVVSAKGSSAATFRIDDAFALTTCDYNNFFKMDNNNAVFINGWYNLDNFIGARGLNIHSVSVDPQFINDSVLTGTSGCLDGIAFSGIAVDINDSTRGVVPDIGAYEVAQVTDDLAIDRIMSQTYPVDSGMQNLEVLVVNRGTNLISSGNISYILNGGPKITETLPFPLAPCDTFRILFSGANQINIANGQPNRISVFTDSPNGIADQNKGNDTLKAILSTPLEGIYTIGTSGADYPTLNSARTDLEQRGVSGPVVFNIKSGIYTEQLSLSNINGADTTNTITFTSEAGRPDSVTITFNPSGFSNNFTIQTLNASFYQFSHLKIMSPFGKVIDLIGSSSYISIDHCILSAPNVTSSQAHSYAVIYTAEYYNGHHISITHNQISGGSSGVYIFGPSTTSLSRGNTISGNTISGAYFSGIFIRNTSNAKVCNNTLTGSSAYSAPFGINSQSCDSAYTVIGNTIKMTTGGTGISVQNCTGTASSRILIANNSVSISGSRASYGIRNQACSYTSIYHNSVLVNSTTSSFAGYFHYNGNIYSSNDIKNNVLANTGNGVAMYFHNPVPAMQNAESDYNNLYATGPNLIQRGTPNILYANINAWRAILTINLEKHSLSYRPGFTSNTDLKPNSTDSASWALNGRGIHLDSGIVSKDLNDVMRPLSREEGVPDIGAFEFTPVVAPPLAIAVPPVATAGSTQSFLFGSDTVATINWDPSSALPSTIKFRYYSGEAPPYTGASDKRTNAYWNLEMNPDLYLYDLNVYYNAPLLGNIPIEADMKMSRYVNGNGWKTFHSVLSTSNPATGILSASSLNEPSMIITGTDEYTPLPVSLISFKAGLLSSSDVLLEWKTAMEINNRGFNVQRLSEGKWETITFVKGTNKETGINTYRYTDIKPFSKQAKGSVIYYRIQQIDDDHKSSYSHIESVSNKSLTSTELVIYPNPFTHDCYMSLNSKLGGRIKLIICDAMGATVSEQAENVHSGENHIRIHIPESLETGIYFIKTILNDEILYQKLIKE